MTNNHKQSERGVVILFAVLLVSVVLTISLGVFNITYRQLVLSSIARESEVAFAVADSARNCVMYWNSDERDASQRPFGYYQYTNPNWELLPTTPVSTAISCAGVSLNVLPVDTGSARTTNFQLKFQIVDPITPSNTRDVCADVMVSKNSDVSNQQTMITVNGYNLAKTGSNCIPTDLNRAVNRRLVTVIGG